MYIAAINGGGISVFPTTQAQFSNLVAKLMKNASEFLLALLCSNDSVSHVVGELVEEAFKNSFLKDC